jgi:hypothetical protein
MEKPQFKPLVRRYLLGDLPEEEQRRIEELFMSDAGYREEVLIAEDDLIDDYLDGLLDEHERRRFAEYFLATPQQQQKVRIARTLKRYAAGRAVAIPSSGGSELPQGSGSEERKGRWFNLRSPLILVPMAAGLLIVISLGMLKLNEFRQMRERRVQDETRRNEIEQQLAKVNGLEGTIGKKVFRLCSRPSQPGEPRPR